MGTVCCAVALGMAAVGAAPAAGEVAFVSHSCEDGGERLIASELCAAGIFRVHDDGTGLRRLTTGWTPGREGSALSGDFSPSWSPGGQRIVFARQTGTAGDNQLFVMNADGSDQRLLHDRPPPGFNSEESPAWSPTGEHIAFVAAGIDTPTYHETSRPVVLVDSDGSNPRQLTPAGWETFSPSFTPDGARVVYFGGPGPDSPDHTDGGVFQTDLQGAATERLMFAADMVPAGNGLAISPDGEYVAFTSQGGLFTMRLDGTELVNRTDMGSLTPAWSPLGPTLFFAGIPDLQTGDSGIFKLDLSGAGRPVQITPPDRDGEPDWTLLGGELPDLPNPTDLVPPVVVTGNQLPEAKSTDARLAAAKYHKRKRSRIPFLAVDNSGIRGIAAAVGKRVEGGCRFVRGSKLRAKSRCSKPRYFRVRTAAAWRRRTSRLARGTYEVRFRTTDVKGHRTRHPKRHVVHLH
jgi:Tol biopolymer transport system component